MARILNYFTLEATDAVRDEISEAGGNEVFFVGRCDDAKIVIAIEVFARGNDFSAPALLQVASQGDVVIHNHPGGTLHPSSADISVASILGNDGIGFYIVNNEVSRLYVVVEPFSEKKIVPVDSARLRKALSHDGSVAAQLPEYEHRESQLEMITLVAEAINEDKIAMIEAGTGTGKTLAYLLPIIEYAVRNNERVVISTNTINLQEQLVNKDIPFLRSVLEQEFSAALVKGRSNYACKRKVLEAAGEPDLFADEGGAEELKALVEWAGKSKDGSKSDLPTIPRPEAWEKIQSESDTSLKTRCPFYDECFFYSARRRAAKAEVLVANHHLVFADMALRSQMGDSENSVLPRYQRIVLDEAHNVEEVATNHFGAQVSYLGILRLLRRLYRKKDDKERGLLPFLSARLVKLGGGMPHEKFLQIQALIQQKGIPGVLSLSTVLTETMEGLFSHIEAVLQKEIRTEVKLRLKPETVERDDWISHVRKPLESLVQQMRTYSAKMSDLITLLQKLQAGISSQTISLSVDLQAQLDRLATVAQEIERVLLQTDLHQVRWLELRRGYRNALILRMCVSPLDVSTLLRDGVYNRFKNVILTSATLTVNGKFDYLKQRLGLDRLEEGRLLERCLPAPFDYEEQALVAVPVDVPTPQAQSFGDRVGSLLVEIIRCSRGRAFVLFTSYGMLNRLFSRHQPTIEQMGINVYRQGQENRHRLLERFREDVSSTLFATDSFWEGVDVPGESLQCIVITRLPFRVPSEPVIEARVEALDAAGRNAFMEYTVPQAVIKFRQGFGRLIRHRNDRGAVVVLDKRLVEKQYGRIFLNSLPPVRRVVGPSEQVLAELERFFQVHEPYPAPL